MGSQGLERLRESVDWELDCSVVWLQYGRVLCADDLAVRSPGQSAGTLSQSSTVHQSFAH